MALSILNYFYWDIPVRKSLSFERELKASVDLVHVLFRGVLFPLTRLFVYCIVISLFLFPKGARFPLMVADVVVIVSLYYVERGLKAEKALAEMIEEKELKREEEKIVEEKGNKRLQKAAVRDEQKKKMMNQKHSGSKKTTHNIQQPSKSKHM